MHVLLRGKTREMRLCPKLLVFIDYEDDLGN